MQTHYSARFQRETVILHPGDYYATGKQQLISTVLGSCVAVAFFDPVARIGGLNHFMLPGSLDRKAGLFGETGKYGIFAMEYLINDMIKLGAARSRLKAKIFGGAQVLNITAEDGGTISKANITFAHEYLKTERIAVESSDVGGTTARRIFFYPDSFRVLLKRITGTVVADVKQEEEHYLHDIRQKKQSGGEVTLF